MKQCAIVTGCAGFIGAATTKKLLSLGWEVIGIDIASEREGADYQKTNLTVLGGLKGFNFIQWDLAEDYRNIPLDLARADLMIHLAGFSGVRDSETYPLKYLNNNLKSTIGALSIALSKNIRKFVFASSSTVYGGGCDVPFLETCMDLNPMCAYGNSKLQCERIIQSFLPGELDIAILRLFSVYGPGQRPNLILPKVVDAILNRQPLTLFGDGSQLRDFTFIDDVISGIVLVSNFLCTRNSTQLTLNIGNGKPYSINHLIGIVEQELRQQLKITKLPRNHFELPVTAADISFANETIGYHPHMSLEGGVKSYLSWKVRQLSN